MARSRFAKGKKSFAICDRSGFRVPYKSLKTTWDGLRVEPQEWEPKHPQLTPARNVIDATALFKPRPDNDSENITFVIGFNYDIFQDIRERPKIGVSGTGAVGDVSFEINATASGANGNSGIGTLGASTEVAESGVSGTGAVGTEVGLLEVSGVSANAGTGNVGVEALSVSLTEAGVSGTGAVGTESVDITGWGQDAWNVDEWGD